MWEKGNKSWEGGETKEAADNRDDDYYKQ